MAATDFERLQVSLEANVKKFENELNKARGVAVKALGDVERSTERMSSRVTQLMSSTASGVSSAMGKIAGLIGTGLSAGALKQFADDWQNASNKIAAAGETINGVAPRLSQLTDIALRSRSGLEGTVDFYARLKRATEALAPSEAQLLSVVESVNKAMVVGGAATSERQAALQQLGQALGSGVLQGDELRSLRENAPLIAKAIADSLNVPIAKLKELGEEGKLTSDVVFKALLKLREAVDPQFARTVATIADSLTNLQTALSRYFGELDQARGISATIAGGIQTLANNVDTLGRVAAVAGVAMLAAFGAPILGAVAALVAGPAGILAAVAAVALFSDKITPIAGEIANLANYAQAAFEIIKTQGGAAWSSLVATVQPAIDTITTALTGLGTGTVSTFETVAGAVKTVLNTVIGAFVAAAQTIVATWENLGPALVEVMVNAMNGVIKAVENALGKIVNAINTIPGAVGLPTIPAPKLGEIENAYAGAGARLGSAFTDGIKAAMTRDYLGEAVKGVDDTLNRIRSRANQLAQERRDAERELNRGRALGRLGGDGDINKPLTKPKDDDDSGGGGKKDKKNEFEKELADIEKRILAFQREKDALGLSAFEAAKAEAAFKLLDAAKKAGIPITEELRGKVGLLSEEYAKNKVALDEAKKAQEAFKELQQFIGSNLSSFFSDIVSGGKNASEALMNMTKRLAEAALQAALLGQGPLASLFGTTGTNGGTGGLIGALFGSSGGGSGGLFSSLLPASGAVFSAGGYTGGKSTNEARGVVHGKEFVVKASATKKHRALLEALNAGMPGFMQGGFVGPASAPTVKAAGSQGARAASYAPTYNIDAKNADRGVEQRIAMMLKDFDRNLLNKISEKQLRGRNR